MARPEYDVSVLAVPQDETPEEQRRSLSPQLQRFSSSYRRTQSPASSRRPTWRTRLTKMTKSVEKINRRYTQFYYKLPLWQRILLSVTGLAVLVLSILFLIFNEKIFRSLVPYAQKWRDIPAGWLILWALIFVVSFPPLIGYSSLLTIAGFVFGFPNSWFIAASATIVGSTCSFLASRFFLKDMVNRIVAKDPRFAALSLTLKHDGIKILIMIKLCPLPYSICNGAVATFPTVHWASYALATSIASLKLLLHVFVGARLGEIAEKGEEMDFKTKAISYVSIIIGVAAGVITGWVIYRQTQARARELEAEERAKVQGATPRQLEHEYADDPDALEAAERLQDDEDDISLHDARMIDPYSDDLSDDDEPNDVFFTGDGDDDAELLSPK